MGEKLKLTVNGVHYHLTKMRKAEFIRYDGSTKLGQIPVETYRKPAR